MLLLALIIFALAMAYRNQEQELNELKQQTNGEQMTKLQLCLCGTSKRPRLVRRMDGGTTHFKIECAVCGTCTPFSEHEGITTALWNSDYSQAPLRKAASPKLRVSTTPALVPADPTPSHYEIEKDIPMPARQNVTQYPFCDMEVGDSFFVQAKNEHVAGNIASAAQRWKVRTGFKNRVFSARKETKDGVEGARIWRLANK